MNIIPNSALKKMRTEDMAKLLHEVTVAFVEHEKVLSKIDDAAKIVVGECDHGVLLQDAEDEEAVVCVKCGAYHDYEGVEAFADFAENPDRMVLESDNQQMREFRTYALVSETLHRS